MRIGRRGIVLLVVTLTAAACSSNGGTRPTAHRGGSGPATTLPGSPTTSTAVVAPETDEQRAADAFVWGFPLVVTERTFASLERLVPVDRLTMQPALSNATSRTIVAPNTDTLYAIAPLDLRDGPFVLTLPAIHDRYYSFQLISAYTDSFAYIGTRATNGRAGRWVITPPGWRGRVPAGTTRVAAPTPQLLLLGRFLVTGDADVARVHALGSRITLTALSPATVEHATPPSYRGTPQSVAGAGIGFYDELGDALAVNPPTDPVERAALRGFSALGIGPGRHPSVDVHDTRLRAALAAGVREGARRILAAASKLGNESGGWTANLNVGTYGHDALLRAVVAEVGWGANIAAEAVYAHANRAAGGAPFAGANQYVLHFDRRDLPPVDAFWSVTLYGPDRFFVANAINRFAIGGRTAGLEYGRDGSLDIYIQHDPPAGHESNWLPAPTGRFSLTLRLYLPKASVLEGRYRYPPVRVVTRG